MQEIKTSYSAKYNYGENEEDNNEANELLLTQTRIIARNLADQRYLKKLNSR